MASNSDSSIVTVAEMIDNAFGDEAKNVVHHKIIQSVLYILARQLRLLERRVALNIGTEHQPVPNTSTLSITEVKLHGMAKKKTTSDKIQSSKKDTTSTVGLEKTFKKDAKSKTSSEPESSSTAKSSGKQKKTPTADVKSTGPQGYQELLEKVEQMREQELRVIRQRTDSREEHVKTPTPMASLDSVEATYEKLLIVERIPSDEAKARAARERTGTRKGDAGTQLSVVTQEQFQELVAVVQELMQKFEPVAIPEFPENTQLLHDLRKGASLTDAMAALQLSARLEASEKMLNNLLSIVTELAKNTPEINLLHDDNIEVIFGGRKQSMSPEQKERRTSAKKTKKASGSPSEMSVEILLPQSGEGEDLKKDHITHQILQDALQEMHDEIIEKVYAANARSSSIAETAFKLANILESKLDSSMNLGSRMDHLENLVSKYAEQINVLDTGLSSQMTNYQEELTQMQHDLEMGLETMAEVMANTGGDATAVAELNAHFSDLQSDIDNTTTRQKDLKNIQNNLSEDLNMLQRQIEILREVKSDREEVTDALRDKAGLVDLNGLISNQQFNAVRGDFEKRIKAAYDKFNNQESVWQRAIDDLLRNLNDKSDVMQVEKLREEIDHHLQVLGAKLQFIMDVVGEPNAAALSRRVNRNSACLSCAAPANMKLEETSAPNMPALRPPTIGAEASKPKGDGDHGVCYPGFRIPHPNDPRSHVCNRWCGGSHTVVNKTVSRMLPGLIITPARRVTTELGTDGKSYVVDEPLTKKPCMPCNATAAPLAEVEMEVHEPEPVIDGSSGITSPYYLCPFFRTSPTAPPPQEDVSLTPPTFFDSCS